MTYETACAQATQTAAAWMAAGLAAVTAGAEVARLEWLANAPEDALAAARERAAIAHQAEEDAWDAAFRAQVAVEAFHEAPR